MGFESKILPIVAGVAISSMTLYYFMKKQKKQRNSSDAVSSKKFKSAGIEVVLEDSKADSHCLTKHELVKQVSYQETQVQNVPTKISEETIAVKSNVVEATVGTALEEPEILTYDNNIQAEAATVCNEESHETIFQKVPLAPIGQRNSFQKMDGSPGNKLSFWLIIGIFVVTVIKLIIF